MRNSQWFGKKPFTTILRENAAEQADTTEEKMKDVRRTLQKCVAHKGQAEKKMVGSGELVAGGQVNIVPFLAGELYIRGLA